MAGITGRGGGANVTVGYSGARQQYRSRGRGRGRGRGACHSCGQISHFWRDAVCPNSPLNRNQGNGRGAGSHCGDAVYTGCLVNGVQVDALIDTGAQVTLLNKKTFDRIQP